MTPLVNFSKRDAWHVKDAFEGTLILGGTGSGKTTGAGATIAKGLLKRGFGGLVLTAKPEEIDLWRRRCEETGRSGDLEVFGEGSDHRFNFVTYELHRLADRGVVTESIVDLLITAMESGRRAGGGMSESYWEDACRQLLRSALTLLRFVGEPVTLPTIAEIIASAAQSPEQLCDAVWQKDSFCAKCLLAARDVETSIDLKQAFATTLHYWLQEFPGLGDKTRASIVSMFTALASTLLQSELSSLFCRGTTISPEDTFHGKILVLNLPLKRYHAAGHIAQVMFKYLWQRAAEDRGADGVPVFLWADEAQLFFTRKDAEFQATARSARVATVYLSQNIPGLLNAVGDQRGGRSAVDTLLANLNTKVFHQNDDPQTNRWASDLFSKSWQPHVSFNVGEQHYQQGEHGQNGERRSHGVTQALDDEVIPREFMTLGRGGGGQAEAIVYQAGRTWEASQATHIRVQFKQQ